MQKEVKGMRAEMNMKINEMIAALNKLKIEHQTRTFVRNQPVVKQQVKTYEARGTVIKKSKDTTKEKTRPQDTATQWSNKQIMKTEKDRKNQLHKLARAKRKRTRRSNIPRDEWRNSPPAMVRGRWGNRKALNR